MEFRDLKQQYQILKKDIDAAVLRVFESGGFILGPEVEALEARLAKYVGVKHCVTCANGTEALTLPLMAWGIGKGDAVFVPDFTFFASGEVVSEVGATPIFVDVEKDTFNLSPKRLEEAILRVKAEGKLTPRAIIAVDLYGLPADFENIKRVAKKHGLLVLEDGAQGFGGEINGKKACGFGDVSTTSFFPAKPLGCYGDGGAVFTDDDGVDALLRSLRVHGKGAHKYDNVRIGRNSRLDAVQAAVLGVKLSAFEEYELDSVNKVARMYDRALEGVVKTPKIPEGYLSSWAQYTIILENREQRDGLSAFLKERGIPTMVYYPKPMHLQEAFGSVSRLSKDLENTEFLCGAVLSLPMHPYMTEEAVSTVAMAIREYING